MSRDDWIYAILLAISLGTGHIVKYVKHGRQRQFICASVGAAMVSFVCGFNGLHSFITALGNCVLLIFISPRYCHIASFTWCFGYLAFFRTAHWYGLPQTVAHVNAVQLLLTLKLVGLAFEVHDTANYRKEAQKQQAMSSSNPEKNWELELEFRGIQPNLLDMMLYSYCYIGMLTGPYYKYRTYHDSMYNEYTAHLPTVEPTWNRIKVLPLYAVIFLVLGQYMPVEYVETPEFLKHPFWFRFLYCVTSFMWFRGRIYSAWVLSECLCMTAGFGVYPEASKPKCGHGPTDLVALKALKQETKYLRHANYSFETIHNIDEYGCEFTPTIREGMRAWNMSVQYWLANFVYKRVASKATRTHVTMLVSAYWHGIHPGYFLSFITIPFALMAEDSMAAAFRQHLTSEQSKKIYDWLAWFCKMRTFEYCVMAFLLLKFDSTINYWSSVFFFDHIMIALGIIVGLLFKKSKHSKAA